MFPTGRLPVRFTETLYGVIQKFLVAISRIAVQVSRCRNER